MSSIKQNKKPEPYNSKIVREVCLNNPDYYLSEKQFKVAVLNTNGKLKKAVYYMMTKAYLYAKLEVMLREYDFGKDFSFIDTTKLAKSVNQRLIDEVRKEDLFLETGANLWCVVIMEKLVKVVNQWLSKNTVYALKSISNTCLRMTDYEIMPDKRVRICSIQDWIDEPWMLTQILENVVAEKY